MSISRLHNRLLAVMIILAMVFSLSAVDVHATGSSSSIKLQGLHKPTKIERGHSFGIWGKIKAKKKIDRVEIGIVKRSTGKWVIKYTKKNVNKKTFSIIKADKKLKFGTLKPGKYYYRINVKLKGKKKKRVLNRKFAVVDSSADSVIVSVSGNGTETSTDKDTGTDTEKDTGTGKDTSADTKKDTNTGKDTAADTKKDTEKSKETAKDSSSDSSNTSAAADLPEITLSGFKKPISRNVGKVFIPKGIVTCSSKIKKVEVGIVFAPTNKWTEYKYTEKVNANSFDLAKIYPSIRIDLLPGGTYYYRMYVHTAEGVSTVFNKRFTVKPSTKPQLAVNWAIDIANDDTFNYGAKPIANAIGCYFCGTNDKKVKNAKRKKMKDPERYEKTYVCMTFVGAAYAHGAGDPEILDQCQKRRMTLYETNDNFTQFSCWMKIGLCKDLSITDLQPGDVLIKWSDNNDNNGHACMYIGGDDLVEASGGGWSAKSIGVKKGVASARLASLSNSSKNYVMRYRH